MQRPAAVAYVVLLLVVTVGSYGVVATSSPPPIEVQADHEFQDGSSETVDGTSYNVTDLNGTAGEATIEWADGNESTSVAEGGNVTLGGTTYTAHFEGETLQLVAEQEAYMDEVREIEEHDELMSTLTVLSVLSGLAAALMIAAAFMPVSS